MSMQDNSKIIYPLHPVFEDDTITIEECYRKASIIGISPQTLLGIYMGKIRPNEIISKRLKNIMSEEQIKSIVKNYDPFRNVDFTDDIYEVNIVKKYPVVMLKAGDSIRTDDNRWIRLSKVVVQKRNVVLYSLGTFLGKCSKNDYIVAHIAKRKVGSGKQNTNEKQALIKKIKKDFKNMSDEDLQARDILLDKMLEKYD